MPNNRNEGSNYSSKSQGSSLSSDARSKLDKVKQEAAKDSASGSRKANSTSRDDGKIGGTRAKR